MTATTPPDAATSRETLAGEDGTPISLVCASPASPRAIAILWPALGVPAVYYERAVGRLAQLGIAAAALEMRGQGESPIVPARGVDFAYQDLLDDLSVTLRTLRERHPGIPVVLLGHSLGGHLALIQLALDPRSVDAVVLITTATPHHEAFVGASRWKVWFGTRMARFVSLILGYYPGHRLGFGGIQSKALIREWSSMGRSGKYVLEGTALDIEAALQDVSTPILALPIRGDVLAPRAACEAVVAKVPNASVEWVELGSPPLSPRGVHHQRWAREPDPVMDEVGSFIERRFVSDDRRAIDSARSTPKANHRDQLN